MDGEEYAFGTFNEGNPKSQEVTRTVGDRNEVMRRSWHRMLQQNVSRLDPWALLFVFAKQRKQCQVFFWFARKGVLFMKGRAV